MADTKLASVLHQSAVTGGSKLKLLAGAIGGLDALGSASVGKLEEVIYTGRKPPSGWHGSPAEKVCDLNALTAAHTHFTGSAREAALLYPKNANVAASIAMAGIGFEKTMVDLIADPAVSRNTHTVKAKGSFGTIEMKIEALPLPDNPKTSALAAMSIVKELYNRISPVSL